MQQYVYMYSPNSRFLVQETFPKTLPRFVLILVSLQRWQHRVRKETKHFVSSHLIGPQLYQHDSASIKMAAPMEVSLPQTMLQKLLDLLKLESLKFCLKRHVHVICHIRCQANIDYHKQHESAALIGLFHMTSSVHLWRVTRIIGNRRREEYRDTSSLCS